MKFSNFFRNSQLFSPQSASVGSGSQGASRAVYLNFNESPFGPCPRPWTLRATACRVAGAMASERSTNCTRHWRWSWRCRRIT